MRGTLLSTLFSSVFTASCLLLSVLLPVVFFPFLPGVFDEAKYVLTFVFAVVGLLGYAGYTLLTRRLVVHRSLWTLGFVLLLLSTIVTLIFSAPNRAEAISASGLFFVSLGLFYLTYSTLITKRFTSAWIFSLAASGVGITLLSTLEKVGVNFSNLFGVANGGLDGVFPNGGGLTNAAVLLTALAALLTLTATTKQFLERIVALSLCGVLTLGLILNVATILPGKSSTPVLLPFWASWNIALDVLKDPKTALIGVGPTEYANAFALYKPVALNRTETWAVKYASARNVVLHTVVTHGIFGVVALAVLLLGMLAALRRSYRSELPLLAIVVVIVILLLIIPASPILWVILTGTCIAWQAALRANHASTHELATSEFTLVSVEQSAHADGKRVVTGVITGITLLFAVVSFYLLYRVSNDVLAQARFAQALGAVRANKAKESYDLTRQSAIRAPYQPEVRRTFSSINLLIAQGLLQKKDITEADRKTAITLVQQAISEAKAAVALNPADSANWVALATVYEALIGSANQADQWTIAAYTQAIVRDPANPKLRVDLGGVFRKLKNDEQASRLFEQAAQLKPDYANAYFNMADVARSMKRSEQELILLKRTLQLITSTDQNRKTIADRIAVLEREVESSKKQVGSTPESSGLADKTASSSARPKESTTSAKIDLPDDSGIATNSAIPEVPAE